MGKLVNMKSVKLHTDPNVPPSVGDLIYIQTAMYIDHGEDDILGGLATVTKVTREDRVNGGTWAVAVKEVPNVYYWNCLAHQQTKLASEFKNSYAKRDPDI